MKKFTSFLVAMLLIIGTIPTGFAVPAPVMHEIYVATDGSDSNDGTISSPFKTFERAKEEVEKLNKNIYNTLLLKSLPNTWFSYLQN